MTTFGGWLQTLLINDATVGYELYMLAKKPSSTILDFQGYEINENTFSRATEAGLNLSQLMSGDIPTVPLEI
jgi:hypothetical protein